jgi:hypothetical protein
MTRHRKPIRFEIVEIPFQEPIADEPTIENRRYRIQGTKPLTLHEAKRILTRLNESIDRNERIARERKAANGGKERSSDARFRYMGDVLRSE